MQKSILYPLLFILLSFVAIPQSHAGFRIKKAATHSAVVVSSSSAEVAIHHNSPSRVLSYLKEKYAPGDNGGKRKPSESGWEGILGFVFGVLGPTGIMAMIFGGIGMGKGHKHRELGIAGFVLGCVRVGVLIAILTVVAISAS